MFPMKKKKTTKKFKARDYKLPDDAVKTYNPYGAMHGLSIDALSERIDAIEEDIEMMIRLVDFLINKMPKNAVVSTTYMANPPSR